MNRHVLALHVVLSNSFLKHSYTTEMSSLFSVLLCAQHFLHYLMSSEGILIHSKSFAANKSRRFVPLSSTKSDRQIYFATFVTRVIPLFKESSAQKSRRFVPVRSTKTDLQICDISLYLLLVWFHFSKNRVLRNQVDSFQELSTKIYLQIFVISIHFLLVWFSFSQNRL